MSRKGDLTTKYHISKKKNAILCSGKVEDRPSLKGSNTKDCSPPQRLHEQEGYLYMDMQIKRSHSSWTDGGSVKVSRQRLLTVPQISMCSRQIQHLL